MIVGFTLVILAWFGAHFFYGGSVAGRTGHFVMRIAVVYGLTLAVSALMLLAVDRFPIATEPLVALKRAAIVALPASAAGTVVDSMH